MAEVKVNPGKVTLAGNISTPLGFHGHLTSWDLVDGKIGIIRGIASKWELSNDAETTTFTI
jgi:hypothetical protein